MGPGDHGGIGRDVVGRRPAIQQGREGDEPVEGHAGREHRGLDGREEVGIDGEGVGIDELEAAVAGRILPDGVDVDIDVGAGIAEWEGQAVFVGETA